MVRQPDANLNNTSMSDQLGSRHQGEVGIDIDIRS